MEVRTPDPPRLPKHVPAKNTPDFTHPNKDTPKTYPVLGLNLRRGTFRGVCNTPLYGYKKNLAGFRCKPLSRGISGRMLLRPYTGTCKTRPVLGANPFRRTCRGVCNTPLHGYVQNLSGFTFPHTDAPKTHPISPSPIRIRRKLARFYTQTFAAGHFGVYAFAPLHGYVHNSSSFIFPHPDTSKTHPVSYFPIGIRPKPARF